MAELSGYNNMPTCDHDYYNAVRKGRAHYVCPKCDADISLAVILIALAVSEEEKIMKNQITPLAHKISKIEELVNMFKDIADFNRDVLRNEQYAQGVEYCIDEIEKALSKQ